MSCRVCVEGAPGVCFCGPEPEECFVCHGTGRVDPHEFWTLGPTDECWACDGHGTLDPSDADRLVEFVEEEAADWHSLMDSLGV